MALYHILKYLLCDIANDQANWWPLIFGVVILVPVAVTVLGMFLNRLRLS